MLIKAGEPQRNIGGRAFIVLLVALVTLTPTYSAFAEIHATPVVEPTPIPENEDPTPVGTPGEPEKVGTQSGSVFQPMAVTEEGSLSGCTQVSTIVPGGFVSVTCNSTYGFDIGVLPTARVMRPDLRPPQFNGFQAAMEMSYTPMVLGVISGSPRTERMAEGRNPASVDLNFGVLSLISAGSLTGTVTTTVYAPTDAEYGATFTATFSACRWGLVSALTYGCIDRGSVTISLVVVPPELEEDTDYTFSCTPFSTGSVAIGQRGESTCTVRGLGDDPLKVRVEEITRVLTSTAGWDVKLYLPGSSIPLNFSPAGVHRLGDPPILGNEQTFVFDLELIPTACTAQSPLVSISVGVSGHVDADTAGATSQSTVREITATLDPSTTVDGEVIKAPEEVGVKYSITSTAEQDTSMDVRFTVNGCEPWTGSISLGEFQNEDIQTSVQPVPSVTSMGVSNPSTATYHFVSPDTLIIESDEYGHNFTFEFEIGLTYTIPASTPVGKYTSTITVTQLVEGDTP